MLLLDSNAFYWLLTEPHRLGPRSKDRISDAAVVYVSAITILELTIKQLKAKLPAMDFASAIEKSGLKTLEIDHVAAAGVGQFPSLVDHDPFDRALIAHAIRHKLDFLTSDRKLLALGQPWIFDSGE